MYVWVCVDVWDIRVWTFDVCEHTCVNVWGVSTCVNGRVWVDVRVLVGCVDVCVDIRGCTCGGVLTCVRTCGCVDTRVCTYVCGVWTCVYLSV